MMITWQLWRALRNPPEHEPLYRRTMYPRYYQEFRPIRWMVIGGEVMFYAAVLFWPFIIRAPYLLAIMLLNDTLFGALWAVEIGGELARTRESRLHDLFAVTPLGTLGVSWVISSACVHRNYAYQRLNAQNTWMVRGVIVLPLTVVLALSMPPAMLENAALLPFFYALAIIVVLSLDHVQATIICVLVGMLLPTWVTGRLENRALAFGVVLFIQFTTYLSAIMFGFVVLPKLYESLGIFGALPDISLALGALGVVYGMHELAIWGLWRVLGNRLDVTPSDRTFLLNPVTQR